MIYSLAITGPTASGKTALSLEIAKALCCEIICLDSMQIYKGMDIGTAKATKEEQEAAPHHCLDILSPKESFSAKAYRDVAMTVAKDISERGNIPLFVGGTGLYLATLMRPCHEEPPEACREYREKIESALSSEADKIALWERLRTVDPEAALAVHYNNVRRVIRALEIYDATGKTKSYFDALTKTPNNEISICHVTLGFHDRDALYRRIDERVDLMMTEGLADEVRQLLLSGELPPDSTAAQAIGYKEMIEAISCDGDTEAAAEKIKKASRNYAKRQMTWFRHAKGAQVIYCDTESGEPIPREQLANTCLDIFRTWLRDRRAKNV